MKLQRESFPTASQAALLLLAWFLLQYMIGCAIYDLREALDLSREEQAAMVVLLANGVLIAALMQFCGLNYRKLLHPSKVSMLGTFVLLVPPVLMLTPLIVFLDVQLISGLETIFPLSMWEEQAFASMLEPSLAACVMTCVIAPVAEELLFRGILLRSFLTLYPRSSAIGYSALYFGVAHLNIYQFVLAFLLGLLLGQLYERTRSLIPCIAMHASINFGVYIWSISKGTSQKITLEDLSIANWIIAVVAAAIGAATLHLLLARRESNN